MIKRIQSRRGRSKSLSVNIAHSEHVHHEDLSADSHAPSSLLTHVHSESGIQALTRRETMRAPMHGSNHTWPFMNSNDKRKARLAEQLQLMTSELVESVCEVFMTEQKVCSIIDLIGEWNGRTLSYAQDQSGERPVAQREAVAGSIQNFMNTLPARYALGIESPAEVMVHMRFLVNVRKNPWKSVVHIHSFDDSEVGGESPLPMQLAFSPVRNGMCNLKIITIACSHTIGLMELVSRMLVSGGSEILDVNCMLSSEKIMLVSQICNGHCFAFNSISIFTNTYYHYNPQLLHEDSMHCQCEGPYSTGKTWSTH